MLCLLSNYVGAGEKIVPDPDEVVMWGHTPCGDMAVYTYDGEAGWFNHGARRIDLIGSEADMIDWVFGRLRRGEPPYPQ
jgi:hypothetical protein